MLQDLEKKGFSLHPVSVENNKWKAVVFKDGDWLRDEDITYSNMSVSYTHLTLPTTPFV